MQGRYNIDAIVKCTAHHLEISIRLAGVIYEAGNRALLDANDLAHTLHHIGSRCFRTDVHLNAVFRDAAVISKPEDDRTYVLTHVGSFRTALSRR